MKKVVTKKGTSASKSSKDKALKPSRLVTAATFKAEDEMLPALMEVRIPEALIRRVAALSAWCVKLGAFAIEDKPQNLDVFWLCPDEDECLDLATSLLKISGDELIVDTEAGSGPVSTTIPLSALFALSEGRKLRKGTGVVEIRGDIAFYAETSRALRILLKTYIESQKWSQSQD